MSFVLLLYITSIVITYLLLSLSLFSIVKSMTYSNHYEKWLFFTYTFHNFIHLFEPHRNYFNNTLWVWLWKNRLQCGCGC